MKEKHINTLHAEIEEFNKAIFISDESSAVELITFVESPFNRYGKNDIISRLYQGFMESPGSPALPIFYFFTAMAHWNNLNNARLKVPKSLTPIPLTTWTMALSPSGTNKSKNIKTIQKLLPANPDGSKPLVASFPEPQSKAALVAELERDKKGFLWQDEASNYWERFKILGSNERQIMGALLKIREGETVSHSTKSEGNKTIEGAELTVLFTNTIDLMIKAVDLDDFVSGIFRRFCPVMTNETGKEEGFFHNDHMFADKYYVDEILEILTQDITNKIYTISPEAEITMERTARYLKERVFHKMFEKNIYGGQPDKPFFNTYLFEANRYAVFHHQFHKKEGTEIDSESMQFGIKISVFFIKSYLHFRYLKKIQNAQALEKVEKHLINRIEQVRKFIKENEGKVGFGSRAVQRKFNINKSQMLDVLREIKIQDPKFKTSLYELLK